MATVSVFCGAGFLGRVAVRRLAAAGIAWRVATWQSPTGGNDFLRRVRQHLRVEIRKYIRLRPE